MKMRQRVSILLCFALAMEAGTATVRPEEGAGKIPLKSGDRVLFVGNSLIGSESGGLGAYVAAALRAGDPSVEIVARRMNKWGKGLGTHLEATDYATPDNQTDLADASKGLLAQIAAGFDGRPWDVVVLQGYGNDQDADPAKFYGDVRRLVLAVRAAGAEPVLFMRWGLNPDKHGRKELDAQTDRLERNYQSIGRELGVRVVPLARIWHDLVRDPVVGPGVPAGGAALMYKDGIHQSDVAKAVNTYAFVAVLMARGPEGVKLTFGKYQESADPKLDAELERRVAVRTQPEVEAFEQRTTAPVSGSATVRREGGDLIVTIRGKVKSLALGSPTGKFGQGVWTLGSAGPVQSDGYVVAFAAEDGLLPEGEHRLAGLAAGLGEEGGTRDLLWTSVTPERGPAGRAEVK
jgi:hypothetical protein